MATKKTTPNPLKGRPNKNAPYQWMTDEKWGSLGETMTIKEALDLWWNCIHVRLPNGDRAYIYKCSDGWYEIDSLLSSSYIKKLKLDVKKVLALKITLDNEYDEDDEENPIVSATLIEQK